MQIPDDQRSTTSSHLENEEELFSPSFHLDGVKPEAGEEEQLQQPGVTEAEAEAFSHRYLEEHSEELEEETAADPIPLHKKVAQYYDNEFNPYVESGL